MDERPDTARSGERWQAAGVRHAVLLRALPGLRHDVAAPISVMQMTASVLQRKLAIEPTDARYLSQRVAAFKQQIDVLTDALHWLFDWGVGVADSVVSRVDLVSHCVGLLQPLWALEGVAIVVDSALQPADATARRSVSDASTRELRWPRQAALRYLLLAALCYVHDRRAGLTGIRVVADRHDALHLHGVHAAQDDVLAVPSTCVAEPQQVPVCIDATALACLAADLGYLIRFGQDSVWLQLSDRRRTGGQAATDDVAQGAVRY